VVAISDGAGGGGAGEGD
jgi:hypothetical protein